MGIQITKRTLFAIQIVEHLSQAQGAVGTEALSELLGISGLYVNQVTHPLIKAGVLVSERGPGGGFRLARPAEEIDGADLAEALPKGICPDDEEDTEEVKRLRAVVRELVTQALKKIRFKTKTRRSK